MTLLEDAVFLASTAAPKRLTDIESWHQHIPFAFALIGLMKPKLLVELGTHRGDSYCAFCQAITETGCDTRSFAVDTWAGDPQAGEYNSEILDDLRQHHDPLYGHFSTLLQMRFDEALTQFDDGSIELLHIDGLHTEEAVRHDFETWLPKMSPSGVILFHDTTVYQEGYEVWKFWKEIAGSYPHFEFAHGHGMGVLLVGSQAPTWLRDWCMADSTMHDSLCKIFHTLGERLHANRHLELYRNANTELWRRTVICEAQNEKLGEESNLLREEIAQLNMSLIQCEHYRQGLESKMNDILSSTSWKLTAPLRRIKGWLIK